MATTTNTARTKIVDLRPEWIGDVGDVFFRVLEQVTTTTTGKNDDEREGEREEGEEGDEAKNESKRRRNNANVEVVVGDETARIVFRCSDRKEGAFAFCPAFPPRSSLSLSFSLRERNKQRADRSISPTIEF